MNLPTKLSMLLALGLTLPFAGLSQPVPFKNPYAFGLDVSFIKQKEDKGMVYYDEDGTKKPGLQIFKDNGYNWGRIMICNEPVTDNLVQNSDYVITLAKDLKKYGYYFLLDYMFSNGWANPMKQPTPSKWVDMKHEERVKVLHAFFTETLTAMKKADVLPDMIQVGNEIGNGVFWPDGRVSYKEGVSSNWKNFTDYLKAAIKAIKEVTAGGKEIKIMLHVDHGGDMLMTKNFCDKMIEYRVSYDVLGVSFYPWSHGTLIDLRDNMNYIAENYKKEIIVVETGYYYKQSTYFQNIEPPFPETPEGQKAWFAAVNEMVLRVPHGLGRGVFWWEPTFGTRGFFDEKGKVQPIVNAFDKYTRPKQRVDGQERFY